MSEIKNDENDEYGECEQTTEHAVGRMRLLPSVNFGVRAAALAQIALPVAVVTAGIAAAVQGAGAENLVILETSCCPPSPL
ncbi:hypothetical protein FHR83_008440 [Actinoplanes campanulatus]|uniref:Uncharacterized protein n=1 Tax=Actinoplanes campanulatus TaxID=113559 RepID=A0A7W5AR11_9ACTN|nr:hypothetical protein [Actinoplanes campanulatus]MBB3100715.1 hypothetical protein [Actinoplanes campanulatus]GGN45987.1 hypothetical protein GCM10010109_80700 [Actinoplanes campanulatus]GID41222.1 hypothetical protein Aca09nite_77280 [Actinoplanes campanulatus]